MICHIKLVAAMPVGSKVTDLSDDDDNGPLVPVASPSASSTAAVGSTPAVERTDADAARPSIKKPAAAVKPTPGSAKKRPAAAAALFGAEQSETDAEETHEPAPIVMPKPEKKAKAKSGPKSKPKAGRKEATAAEAVPDPVSEAEPMVGKRPASRMKRPAASGKVVDNLGTVPESDVINLKAEKYMYHGEKKWGIRRTNRRTKERNELVTAGCHSYHESLFSL